MKLVGACVCLLFAILVITLYYTDYNDVQAAIYEVKETAFMC